MLYAWLYTAQLCSSEYASSCLAGDFSGGREIASQNQTFLYHLVVKEGGCNNTLPDQRNASARETQGCPYTADSSRVCWVTSKV